MSHEPDFQNGVGCDKSGSRHLVWSQRQCGIGVAHTALAGVCKVHVCTHYTLRVICVVQKTILRSAGCKLCELSTRNWAL